MVKPVSPQILEKAIKGDHQAFREVVESHQGFVYALAYRMTGNEADAEDITQESFLRLWKIMARYNRSVKVSTWLYSTTTNLCLDLLKSKYRCQSRMTGDTSEAESLPAFVSVEDTIHEQELLQYIEIATGGLPPLQKAVFVLRHLEMLSVEETCDALSLSATQVKAHLYLARKQVAATIHSVYENMKKKHI